MTAIVVVVVGGDGECRRGGEEGGGWQLERSLETRGAKEAPRAERK